MRLLFGCLGNICRSPMLEGWMLHQRNARPELAWLQVDSCGIQSAHVGEAPDPRAIHVAAEHGVDLSALRARQLVPADFERFDVILFADASTLVAARRKAPADSRALTARVMEWVDLLPADLDDPWYGDRRDFDACWARVEQAGPRILEKLERMRSR